MAYYKVTLIKKRIFFVSADNVDEAERRAVDVDLESQEDWIKKEYYDEIETEKL